MSPLGMEKIGGLILQVYVGGVTKASIGSMNVGQQKTDKAIRFQLGNAMGSLLQALNDERGSVIPSYCGERVSPEKLKKSKSSC